MQLQDLKKELERCKAQQLSYQSQLEKREQEMEIIHRLKEGVTLLILEIHRSKNVDPKKSEMLRKQMIEECEQIEHLRKSVVTIDHEIDQLVDESRYVEIKERLISNILLSFPEAHIEYQAHQAQLNQARLYHEEANRHKAELTPLLTLFKTGSNIQISGGFLNTFLERNPKARLARIIHQASELAETIYPRIKEIKMRELLNRFLAETKKTWYSSLYKGLFSDFYHRLRELMEEQHEAITTHEAMITFHEQAFESWLNKYCDRPLA